MSWKYREEAEILAEIIVASVFPWLRIGPISFIRFSFLGPGLFIFLQIRVGLGFNFFQEEIFSFFLFL